MEVEMVMEVKVDLMVEMEVKEVKVEVLGMEVKVEMEDMEMLEEGEVEVQV